MTDKAMDEVMREFAEKHYTDMDDFASAQDYRDYIDEHIRAACRSYARKALQPLLDIASLRYLHYSDVEAVMMRLTDKEPT